METPGITQVIRIDSERPDPAVLARAGKVIREGGLVAFPTETVYGLGANALDVEAVQRIFAAKRRAPSDPLIVHLADAGQLETVARDVPDAVRVLAARFWPGPLTVVLPKQDRVPANVTAGLPTVAVRVPRHAVALGLLRAAGVPIAAPSANLFTRTSATTAAHVIEDLGGRVNLVLDGGPTEVGIESTVIAVADGQLRLLRPGAVPVEDILGALEEHKIPTTLVVGAGAGPRAVGAPSSEAAAPEPSFAEPPATGAPAASPGMLDKHYSPRATLLFFSGPAESARAAMRTAVHDELARGRRVGLLLCREDVPLFSHVAGRAEIEDLGSCSDLATVARHLFAAMRHLDTLGVDTICVRSVPAEGLGRAIVDRLTRAAARKLYPPPPRSGQR